MKKTEGETLKILYILKKMMPVIIQKLSGKILKILKGLSVNTVIYVYY